MIEEIGHARRDGHRRQTELGAEFIGCVYVDERIRADRLRVVGETVARAVEAEDRRDLEAVAVKGRGELGLIARRIGRLLAADLHHGGRAGGDVRDIGLGGDRRAAGERQQVGRFPIRLELEAAADGRGVALIIALPDGGIIDEHFFLVRPEAEEGGRDGHVAGLIAQPDIDGVDSLGPNPPMSVASVIPFARKAASAPRKELACGPQSGRPTLRE